MGAEIVEEEEIVNDEIPLPENALPAIS